MASPDFTRQKGGRSRNDRRRAQCALAAAGCRDWKSQSFKTLAPKKPQARVNTSHQLVATLPTTSANAPLQECSPANSRANSPVAEETRRRSVSFDLEAGTQHEITPYAEIYGIHPSDFLFERNGFVLLLADDDLYDEEASDEEEDDEELDGDVDEDPAQDNWVVVTG